MTHAQADRTRTLLSQLAGGEAVSDAVFAPGRVAVVLAADDCARPQAQLSFSFAVNLLARLSPVVQQLDIVLPEGVPLAPTIPRRSADALDEHLFRLLDRLRPPVVWRVGHERRGSSECELVVGAGRTDGVSRVFVGVDGWRVALSFDTPQAVSDVVNPVGAYAAACIAVSEVWKRLLKPHMSLFEWTPIVPLDVPLHFSTFTYRAAAGEPNPPLPDVLALDTLTMIGLGAGGGATAFTFASFPSIKGVLNLIDPDIIEMSNLNRYVFADAQDVECHRSKATVAGRLFAQFPGLTVREQSVTFSEAVGRLDVADFRHVVAAVHSREARREIQMETPMVLWDAAAEDGEFAIWRMILGKTECMWCKHPADASDPERRKANQLTDLLGLDATAWLRKIRDNEPFAADEVTALCPPTDPAFDLPTVDQRYGDWEASQCGRLRLPAMEASVPVPFAPVMAGILLAGEIIKEAAFADAVLDSYYWNTLLGKFMAGGTPYRRAPRNDCRFCRDDVYLRQYERRWRRSSD